MKSFRSLSLVVILTGSLFTSCGKASVGTPPSSTAGAITANSAINNTTPRSFGRQNLNSGGSQALFEFLRPDVRAKLDEEPVGDTDGGFDSATSITSSGSDQTQGEGGGESQAEEQQQQGNGEDANPTSAKLESKFAWAKKSFGDALKADIASYGVIVLYADDNFYDAGRLMEFVERGRDMIAERSGVGGDRIQVVYGGYRRAAQVEYWIVPQGGSVPEFKPEDRTRPADPED